MKTKISFLIGALCVLCFGAVAQDKPFVIKGSITGKPNSYVYLTYQSVDNKTVIDSAAINNGKFVFKGSLPGITEVFITSTKRPMSLVQYFSTLLSTGVQKIELNADDFSTGVISGTPVSAELKLLAASRAELLAKYTNLLKVYEAANIAYSKAKAEKADEATTDNLKKEASKARYALEPLQALFQQKDLQFMDKYPGGYVAAYLLKSHLRQLSVAEAGQRYAKLAPEVAASRMGVAIKSQIDEEKGGAVGAVAANFSSKELRGDQLSLSDYKGRYVLVDFWASWCVPCRQGNPHLLSLYAKYKDKGLEIIGVSDDDGKPDAWKKAVEQDQIGVWKHILRGLKKSADGGYDRSESIADKYAIHSLPTKVLINPKGVIVGRYGGGGESDAAMEKKLDEIFSK